MSDDGWRLHFRAESLPFCAHWIWGHYISSPHILFSGNICQRHTQSIYLSPRINIIYIFHYDYRSLDFFQLFFPFFSTYKGLKATFIILLLKNLSTSANWRPIISSYLQTKQFLFNAKTLKMFSILFVLLASWEKSPLLRNVVLKHRIRESALCEVTNGTDGPSHI